MTGIVRFVVLLVLAQVVLGAADCTVEEIEFTSGQFSLVGDLRLPAGEGPFPVVVFVHGDGPNSRTAGVTYPPIMERMAAAGYATFSWDKPGTGESTGELTEGSVQAQRARIVLDAIEVLKARGDIDPGMIGLWGISQAGYVMPRVIAASDDVAFMIAVSCPGEPGVEQGAYLLAAQAVCEGLPEEDRAQVEELLGMAGRAQTFEQYAAYKSQLQAFPAFMALDQYGVRVGIRPEEDWEPDDPAGEYFWDPIQVIETTTIPVLAFFGGKDTQADPVQGVTAYTEALERAGNPFFRVELIPGVDHNLIICQNGSLAERSGRSIAAWTKYSPEYLDILEQWLRDLRTR